MATANSSDAECTGTKKVLERLEPVLRAYFPKIKIKDSDSSIHFEYKARKYASNGHEVLGPNPGGIVGDINLRPGKYDGNQVLPAVSNETLYVSLLLAPYMAAEDRQVYTRILYPSDLPIGVVNDIKDSLNSLDSPTQEEHQQATTPGPGAANQTQAPETKITLSEEVASAPVPPVREGSAIAKVSPVGDGSANSKVPPVRESSASLDEGKSAKKDTSAHSPSQPATALPKPTTSYFKKWFADYFAMLDRAAFIEQVNPYCTNGFRSKQLGNCERLDAAGRHAALLKFRSQCRLKDWSIDKVQAGPWGCMDVVFIGVTLAGHPGYVIYRMVSDGGVWRIDSGLERYWYTIRNGME